jgi:hypothetical protein
VPWAGGFGSVNVAVAACLVLVADWRKSGFKFECMCACTYVDEIKCCLEFLLNFLSVFVINFFFLLNFLSDFVRVAKSWLRKGPKKENFFNPNLT